MNDSFKDQELLEALFTVGCCLGMVVVIIGIAAVWVVWGMR